jgi:hypothetical protein
MTLVPLAKIKFDDKGIRSENGEYKPLLSAN